MRRSPRPRSNLVAGFILGLSLAAPALAGHGVEDTVENIAPERVKQLLDAGEKVQFIDLRPENEFRKSRLPGARSLPIDEVAKRFGEVPKTGRVVLYCDCRPAFIADRAIFLEYRGHKNIFVMPEGFSGWVKRGFPLDSAARR
jgi:rhodanese-related sulfurtransferase